MVQIANMDLNTGDVLQQLDDPERRWKVTDIDTSGDPELTLQRYMGAGNADSDEMITIRSDALDNFQKVATAS